MRLTIQKISVTVFLVVFMGTLIGTALSVIALQGVHHNHSSDLIVPQKTYVHSRLNSYLMSQRYDCVLLDDYVCVEKQ